MKCEPRVSLDIQIGKVTERSIEFKYLVKNTGPLPICGPLCIRSKLLSGIKEDILLPTFGEVVEVKGVLNRKYHDDGVEEEARAFVKCGNDWINSKLCFMNAQFLKCNLESQTYYLSNKYPGFRTMRYLIFTNVSFIESKNTIGYLVLSDTVDMSTLRIDYPFITPGSEVPYENYTVSGNKATVFIGDMEPGAILTLMFSVKSKIETPDIYRASCFETWIESDNCKDSVNTFTST